MHVAHVYRDGNVDTSDAIFIVSIFSCSSAIWSAVSCDWNVPTAMHQTSNIHDPKSSKARLSEFADEKFFGAKGADGIIRSMRFNRANDIPPPISLVSSIKIAWHSHFDPISNVIFEWFTRWILFLHSRNYLLMENLPMLWFFIASIEAWKMSQIASVEWV